MNAILSLLFSALFVHAPAAPDCEYEAERAATLDVTSAERLHIIARAGELRVEGVTGLTEVRVRGRACASDQSRLDETRIATDLSGGVARVEAELPDAGGGWGNNYARLDLVIEVPAGFETRIEDSSGGLEARNLGALDIDDSSGEILVENVGGPLHIQDSSGEITVRRAGGTVVIDDDSGEVEVAGIGGDIEITDGSGSIDIVDVQGTVTLRDGSGDIDVEQVTGSVLVTVDGSGSIRVADVQGDFTVESDGSGDVRYSRVGGKIRVASN